MVFATLAAALVSAGSAACSASTDGSANLSQGDTSSGQTKTGPWDGKTYLLDIPPESWSEPRGIGSEIGSFVPVFSLKVEGSSDDALDLLLGTADAAGLQETCNPTTKEQAQTDPATHPDVRIGPVDFPIYLENEERDIRVSATAYDLTISNVLPDGDTPAEQGGLSAVMDAREIYEMFFLLLSPTADAVCNALEDFGAPCQPCPRDEAPYCLTIKAVGLGAIERSDAGLNPIEANEVSPSCLE